MVYHDQENHAQSGHSAIVAITFGKNPNFCSSACSIYADFSGADSIV